MSKFQSIAIYSRKSKFTGKGESINNQIELCRRYMLDRGYASEDTEFLFYEDEGFSGGNTHRPAFQRMMADAGQKRFQAITVYRLDRISRNISDFAALIQDMERFDISFVSASEDFDTKSPMGRAMMYIVSIFSQLERETIAERIRDNMHELAKTGRWLGGTTPTGYRSGKIERITIDSKSRISYRLVIIPGEAEIIRNIYRLFVELGSLTALETELLHRNMLSKNAKPYSRYTLREILRNPVYLIADEAAYDYFSQHNADIYCDKTEFDGIHGIMPYNRTSQKKSRAARFNPIDEWIISVGGHEGIIPSKLWLDAQAALERNKNHGYQKGRKNQALLSGILYCSCGSKMYPRLNKHTASDGSPAFSYTCRMKEKSKREKCSNANIDGNDLDKLVLEEIKKLSSDNSSFTEELKKAKKICLSEQRPTDSQLKDINIQLDEKQKQLNSLVEALSKIENAIAGQAILCKIEQLSGDISTLNARKTELEQVSGQRNLSVNSIDLMLSQLSDFASVVDTMTLEQKRSAVRMLIDRVVWDGTNAHIVFFGAQKDVLSDIDISSIPESYPDTDINSQLCGDSK